MNFRCVHLHEIYEAADGSRKAVLAVAAEAAESLADDFVECLNLQQRRPSLHIV